jgi:hypothetical protein
MVGVHGDKKHFEFKKLEIRDAVKRFELPCAQRSAENVDFLPTMEEFMECESAEGSLRTKKETFPADKFLKGAQSRFINPYIFGFAGASVIKAADLAINILFELSGCLAEGRAEDNQEVAEEVHQVFLFLWAVEQSNVSEVKLSNPPSSSLFDTIANKVKEKLEPKPTVPISKPSYQEIPLITEETTTARVTSRWSRM